MGRTIIWICYQTALQGYAAKSLSKVTDLKMIGKKSENSPFSVFPIDLHWVHHSIGHFQSHSGVFTFSPKL